MSCALTSKTTPYPVRVWQVPFAPHICAGGHPPHVPPHPSPPHVLLVQEAVHAAPPSFATPDEDPDELPLEPDDCAPDPLPDGEPDEEPPNAPVPAPEEEPVDPLDQDPEVRTEPELEGASALALPSRTKSVVEEVEEHDETEIESGPGD